MTLPRALLILEFLVLCIGVPGVIIGMRFAPFMFAFLWGATLYCWLIMRYHYKVPAAEMWNWSAVTWQNMKPVLIRWVLASIAMVVFIYFYNPERMFYLPRHRPEFLIMLALVYPVMSALPQEFVYCTFFFKRYGAFFGTGLKMVIASAVLFAYAHILYINPVAPVLSLLGGLIFAWDYNKHKSLALVTIEHGLYGNSLFIIGLGAYFYSGGVQ